MSPSLSCLLHRRTIREHLHKTTPKHFKESLHDAYMRLLLSVEKVASQRGHHFTIIKVGAKEMLGVAWKLLESAYYVRLRRKQGLGSRRKPVENALKFDRAKVLPQPHFPEFDDETGKAMEYVVGWALVPSYMIGLRQWMHPVSALDGAFCKSPARGTFTVEVTVDGLFRLHVVGIQHTISAECLWSYQHHFENTKKAYQKEHIDSDKLSVNGDAAPALSSVLATSRPKVSYSACMRHWLQHLCKGTAEVARSLMHIPPMHKATVSLSSLGHNMPWTTCCLTSLSCDCKLTGGRGDC